MLRHKYDSSWLFSFMGHLHEHLSNIRVILFIQQVQLSYSIA